MAEQLPVLVVVIPLLGGALAVFMGKGRTPWLWACAVTALVLAISIALLQRVLADP